MLSQDEIKKLIDPNRVTNHGLFPNKELSTDFCDEKLDIESIVVGEEPKINDPLPIDCVCCECCEERSLSVSFAHTTSSLKELPECATEGNTTYDSLTDSLGDTRYGPQGRDWSLKATLIESEPDDTCRAGLMTATMYDNFTSGSVTNPILPKQLIVDPSETIYIVNLPVSECSPEEPTVTEDVIIVPPFV